MKAFGRKYKVASFFPLNSLLAQRSMVYIKSHHPDQIEATYTALFNALWEREVDLSEPELFSEVLREVFSASDAEAIIAAAKTDEIKTRLNNNTTHAWKDLGAYGAPWFWVSDGKGKEEPFFGSDRWAYM